MLSTAHRAIIAAELTEQRSFTIRLASDVTCVNRVYVGKVRRMNQADRSRLLRGELALSVRKPVSVERIYRFIQRAGADRVMGAIDTLTAPTAVAAE